MYLSGASMKTLDIARPLKSSRETCLMTDAGCGFSRQVFREKAIIGTKQLSNEKIRCTGNGFSQGRNKRPIPAHVRKVK